MDNAPCHPPEDQLVKQTCDGKIWVLYMPPNVTPLIQPMDQNAIRLVKLHYRNSLLSKIITSEEVDIIKFLKQFNLYEASLILALAVKRVSETTLSKCWNKILYRNGQHFDEEDDIPLARLLEEDEDLRVVRNGVELLNTIFPEVSNS